VPESETVVVFKILGALAGADGSDHGLGLDEIVDAVHLGKRHVVHYMAVLQLAGAVRVQSAAHPTCYTLTKYGLARIGR
jgi:DNA-binding IclR family transcriptional regulator